MDLIAGFITYKRRGVIAGAGRNRTAGPLELMNLAVMIIEYFQNTAMKKNMQPIVLWPFDRQNAAIIQAVLIENRNTTQSFADALPYFRTHYLCGAYDTSQIGKNGAKFP